MQFRELDWPQLLDAIAGQASSDRAKKYCQEISPVGTPALALKSIEDILSAQNVISESAIGSLTVLDKISPILTRFNIQAVLDLPELVILREFLNRVAHLKTLLKAAKNIWAETENSRLADFKSQLSAIEHVVSPDGEINETASPTLASLSEERRRLSREVARTLDQIVHRQKIENYLQDKYVTNREGRMVIPVKSGNQHDVKGLIHDASQTKQTVFMEPEEVIPLNNRLREVQILIQEEIFRILKELSLFLARSLTSFENADQTLIDCDVIFAKAQFNRKIHGSQIQFDYFEIFDLRHPLLILQGIDVIPNTIKLDHDHRTLLLSGPNAGGKTILLKSIGLAAQMARCGLPIAAREGSQIPFFKTIDPIVGDLQSVGENLSSFSSHMARLTSTVKYNGPSTLVLVDEICGATDPEEGAALARSFIEHFSKQNLFSVVTSHLGPLKESWPAESGIVHGSLEFDAKTNNPTYQLLLGFPGRSLALAVAKRLGVPEKIIVRAREFLSPESQTRSKELGEIESMKEQIIELKTQTQKDRDEAYKMKTQYFELVNKFREQRDRWLEKALEKANKKIENIIEEARQDRLKNKTLHDIKSELPDIVRSRTPSNRPQTLEEFKAQFKSGAPAYSTRLGRQVVIQGEPDNKGQVLVLSGSMRMQVPWHTLTNLAEEKDKPLQTVTRRSSSAANLKAVNDEADSELDLRGRRVDDAVTLLEKWLDECMRRQQDRVKIIHGFGTEQLKKSVRQFLSKSDYVERWNPGDHNSGGDGITWVYLAD